MVVVPDELAGIGIEGDGAVGVQRIVIHRRVIDPVAQRRSVVSGRGTEEKQVGFGIVAAGIPDGAAAALFNRKAVPAIAAWFAGPGDGVETPKLFSGFCFERDDVIAARRSTGGPDEDLALRDQRSAGLTETGDVRRHKWAIPFH